MSAAPQRVDVAIVGGGPSGLAAAVELRRLGIARVLVLEREPVAGGVPRHTAHTGFGLRDLRRLLDGPAYAARRAALATAAGASIDTEVTVTDWTDGTTLETTGPGGHRAVVARAVLLATGCRERPRAARLVPGTRPLGVLTTATLQQLVHLQHCRVGRRAVVVGAEHVSFSALLTLAEAGVHPVAMVTEHPRHQTYAPLAWATATRLRVPILAASRVTRIVGRERVEAVEVTELGSGAVRRLACDTVVFTGDWIPDHELARRGGLVLDPATRAPRVDQSCRTSTAGVFAAGNLVHAAETADVAALGGRHAARAIAAFLRDETWPAEPTPVTCDAPLLWVSPSALVAAPPVLPRGRFLFRVGAFAGPATLVVEQDSHPLWRKRYRRLAPNASLAARVGWLSGFDPARGPLRFRLDGARAETHVSGRDQTREWKAR